MKKPKYDISAKVNGSRYTRIRGVHFPREKEPFWSFKFKDGVYVLATGNVTVYFVRKKRGKGSSA